MSKVSLREFSIEIPVASRARRDAAPGRRPAAADVEMARVLETAPLRMALDPSGAGIAHWKHGPLHDVVEPMSHHVIMAYNGRSSAWSGGQEARLRSERLVRES